MDYTDVLKHLSPCGLDCARCVDHQDGEIRRLSGRLLELLGGYDRVARLKSDRDPLFEDYPAFTRLLEQFSLGPCGGCRSDRVACPVACKVQVCHREKRVDFCFQCPEYPCADPMDGRLVARWRQRNDRLREIGAVAFYEEQILLPRY